MCIAEDPIPGVGTRELLFLKTIDDDAEGVTHISMQPGPYVVDANNVTRSPQPPGRVPQDSTLRAQLAALPLGVVIADLLENSPTNPVTTVEEPPGTTTPADL